MKSVAVLLLVLLGLVASAFSASSTTGAPGTSTGVSGTSTGASGTITTSGGSGTTGGSTGGGEDDFDVDEYCQDKEDGLYVYPPNCRKYVECATENTVLLCESDYQFNEVELYCDFPERVDCGDRPVCDDNDENCEEDISTTTQNSISYCTEDEVDPSTWVDCEDPANDGAIFPAEPCGPIYCTCSNGDAIKNECPDGLIWNPDTWTCDVCDTNPACDGDDDCA